MKCKKSECRWHDEENNVNCGKVAIPFRVCKHRFEDFYEPKPKIRQIKVADFYSDVGAELRTYCVEVKPSSYWKKVIGSEREIEIDERVD